MIDPEVADEAARLLAVAITCVLEDASAIAVDEGSSPLAAKAEALSKAAADFTALTEALRVLAPT